MKDYKAGDVASNYIIYHTLHNYPVGLVMMCGYRREMVLLKKVILGY